MSTAVRFYDSFYRCKHVKLSARILSSVSNTQSHTWTVKRHSVTFYQSSVQPLCQPLGGGIGDLTSQVVLLLVVHELQRSPQILQQVQHPKATQERWSGRLAVKQPVGVIHGLGALGRGGEEELDVERNALYFTPRHKVVKLHWLIRLAGYLWDCHTKKKDRFTVWWQQHD